MVGNIPPNTYSAALARGLPSKGEMRRASIHEQYDVGTGERLGKAKRTGTSETSGTGETSETGGSASHTDDYGTGGLGQVGRVGQVGTKKAAFGKAA
mgnify:CR=1 FL=1